MSKRKQRYLSYLLRIRRVDNAGRPVWRFSLQSPVTGEQQNFVDLQRLIVYLQAQMSAVENNDTVKKKPIE